MSAEHFIPVFPGNTSIDGLSDIERLTAIEQIKRAKAFYCYAMDTKNWDAYQAVFTDDAVLEVPSQGRGHQDMRCEGAADIRRHVEGLLENTQTCHQVHSPIIDFTSATTANVVWAMEDMLRFGHDKPLNELHGMGHYVERYRRCDDGNWRIAYTRLQRLWIVTQPPL